MKTWIYIATTIFMISFTATSFSCDVNGDGREGLAEAIHALQVSEGFILADCGDSLCTHSENAATCPTDCI